MHLLIERSSLLPFIKRLSSITVKASSTPALGAILLTATESGLRLTATDNAMTAITTVPANVTTPGSVAIPATNLSQVLSVVADDVIDFSLDPETHLVSLKVGRSSYNLVGLPAADFPPAPPTIDAPPIQIEAAALRRIIDQTWFSIAPDDNRYGLNGAHLDSVDTPDGRMLRMVGTDGNRLSYAQAPYTGTLTIGRRMLLPKKPLAEVRKMIDNYSGTVEIGFGERAAVVRFEGATVHMRLLEAEFPNYKEVLPTNSKRTVTVDRAPFVDSLRRVFIFATDGSHSVRFAFADDGITLTARKLDAGDANEQVSAELSGEPITMGFNARFVQDVAEVLTSARITLSLGGVLSPCIIRPIDNNDSALFVVMPVRLD
jgi:DNA polymerase-3 subunit beta